MADDRLIRIAKVLEDDGDEHGVADELRSIAIEQHFLDAARWQTSIQFLSEFREANKQEAIVAASQFLAGLLIDTNGGLFTFKLENCYGTDGQQLGDFEVSVKRINNGMEVANG